VGLGYNNNRQAMLSIAVLNKNPNNAIIYGENNYIVINDL